MLVGLLLTPVIEVRVTSTFFTAPVLAAAGVLVLALCGLYELDELPVDSARQRTISSRHRLPRSR